MYLKQLEIQGFKSFARKTLLEFEPGVISIVGPNGSGKSNFADAIRWVLGEQSMKAIRSKKSEDVIFAGSDKKSKLGMAEVAITFDNEDRALPVDFSEVVIARRLYRDGESEYLINKRQVRLMDIAELLAKSGYGGYSYHIISQGTIDQLVVSGPAAIKQLVEEASGVKPHYIKRDRSLRKLERTEENLRRVADLISEIEPRLRSLRRQTKRAEQRGALISELNDLKRKLFAVKYHEFKKKRDEFDVEITKRDNEIQKLTKLAEGLMEKLKQGEAVSANENPIQEKLKLDLRSLEREKVALTESLATIRGQLKANVPLVGQDPALLELKSRELTGKISELESQLQYLAQRRTLGQKNLEQHKKITQKFEYEMETLKGKLDAARNPDDFNKLKSDVERIYSKFQSLLYAIKHFENDEDRKHLSQDAENFELSIVKLKDRITHLETTTVNYAEIGTLTARLSGLLEKREEAQRQISSLQAEMSSDASKVSFFKVQLEELSQEKLRMDNALKQTNTGHSQSAVSGLLQQEKEKNEKIAELSEQITNLEQQLQKKLNEEREEKKALFEVERKHRALADELSRAKDKRGLVQIERARLDANIESLLADTKSVLGESTVSEIKNSKPQTPDPGIEQKIAKLQAQIETIGGIDDLTLQEYRETEQRYNHLSEQSGDLTKAVADLRAIVAELDLVIKKQFTTGFDKINKQFAEFFRILFSGGRANMTLIRQSPTEPIVEGEDQIEAEESEKQINASGKQEVTGIEVRAVPPGKKLSSLAALSGGERTMTAIALLTAILASFPSPFVVLDEVDAALDEANSIRFAKILVRLAHSTQFITITHNRETMRQAGMIYGVTMGDDGISKVLSIKLDKAVEIAE